MERVLISELMEQQDNVLAHFNPNHDALGRFASGGGVGSAVRSSTGKIKTKISSIASKKTKSVNSGDENKSKKKKSRKQKLEEVKISKIRDEKTARERKAKAAEVVNSGNAKLVYQNRSDLTEDQLKKAISRISTEKELRSLVAEQNPTKMQKLLKSMNKAKSFVDSAETGIKTYNQVARIANTVLGETKEGSRKNVLPYVGEAKNDYRKGDGKTDVGKSLLKATTVSELMKNSEKLNSTELAEAAARAKAINALRSEYAIELDLDKKKG